MIFIERGATSSSDEFATVAQTPSTSKMVFSAIHSPITHAHSPRGKQRRTAFECALSSKRKRKPDRLSSAHAEQRPKAQT
jgi:hypothetical protein